MRIRKYVKHVVSLENQGMDEKDIELLKYLSESLRLELRFAIVSPILTVHPFLRNYAERCPEAAQKVCTHAITHTKVSRGDVVFSTGEIAHKMFFVVRGHLGYTLVMNRASSNPGKEQGSTRVKKGEWVCEPSLWVSSWMHRGDLFATSNCDLCVLDAKSFASLTATHRPVLLSSKMYASLFKDVLCKAEQLTDLSVPGTSLEEMTSNCFPKSRRSTRPLAAFDNLFGGAS